MTETTWSASLEEADLRGMRLALGEAAQAGMCGEVPVGAVVIFKGEVVGAAGNAREGLRDPTAHAEVLAIRQAAARLRSWRLVGATVYVTQEPCVMCAGALVNARVPRLVYGCDNPKAGAVRTLYGVAEDARLNHRMVVRPGVLAEECGALLTIFFENLRSRQRLAKMSGQGPPKGDGQDGQAGSAGQERSGEMAELVDCA